MALLMLSAEECRWQCCTLTLNNLDQTRSFSVARQSTLSIILTGHCICQRVRVRTCVCFTMPPAILILDTRRTLTTYIINNTIFVTTLPTPTSIYMLMCIWYTLIHKSQICIKLVPVSGRVYHLLAALVDVFVVGSGDLLGLVARQLDAAPEFRRNGGFVPALSEKRIYSLDLVPTWKYRIFVLKHFEYWLVI